MATEPLSHEFHWVDGEEPHVARRKEILAKYPQIRELYGPDLRLFPCIVALVALELWLAKLASSWSWPMYLVVAYFVGGTITHALNLASHELSHLSCLNSRLANELLSVFCNLGQGVPSSLTFKKYHALHHVKQGYDGLDTDVPTEWEVRNVNSLSRKVLWCLTQSLFYALRPLVICPMPISSMEIFNLVTVVLFDIYIVKAYGIWSLLFLLFSVFLGMGLHPVAGHFIAEHYEFVKGQETYSYYGPLNNVTFNVGYHNEHHDFPKVSGFRLPLVKKIAPEYYDERWKSADGNGMAEYTSWINVIYEYITDPNIGPYSRVKRGKKNI